MHMIQVIQIKGQQNKGSIKEKNNKETEQNPSLFRLTFKESFQKGDW